MKAMYICVRFVWQLETVGDSGGPSLSTVYREFSG